jgi:hypothetical protein
MALFVDFRGREPSIEALLRHSGVFEGGTESVSESVSEGNTEEVTP